MKRMWLMAALGVVLQAGCVAQGYAHWGVDPQEARGMTQADSACDHDRGARDLASPCYVSRRPWGE